MNMKEIHARQQQQIINVMSRLYSAHILAIQQELGINRHVQENKEIKEGSYPFVPNHPNRIIRLFVDLQEQLAENRGWSGYERHRFGRGNRTKFLDAGCGIGNIMMLAAMTRLSEEIEGLECYDATIRAGREFIARLVRGLDIDYYGWNQRTIRIKKANILKYRNYGSYDIIYYYCPLSNDYLQTMFEERVEDQMKVGAVLLPFMKRSGVIDRDKRFKQIKNIREGLVFMKVSNAKRKKSALKEFKYALKGMNEETRKKYARLLK